ncbi:MAG TPA: FkbM family methyltransferase [Gemmataceae bacterium]
MRVGKYLKPFVPLLPGWLLSRIAQARPALLDRVPAGRSLRWSRYLGDVVVWIDPANAIERKMLCGYEPSVLRAVERFVSRGSHCIDVGANVGAVTLALARHVGESGRVLAIEPGPPYVARLQRNLQANTKLAGRVVILQAGLSDKEASLLWRPDPNHPFNAGLSQVHSTAVPGELCVPVTTLDAVLARQAWKRVDFIKIDVEGMELEVLHGGRKALESLRPVVLFETLEIFRTSHLTINGIADVFAEIETFLRGLNYRLCDLSPDGSLLDVTASALPDNTLAIPIELQI